VVSKMWFQNFSKNTSLSLHLHFFNLLKTLIIYLNQLIRLKYIATIHFKWNFIKIDGYFFAELLK